MTNSYFHLQSLDEFRAGLSQAGFEPVDGSSESPRWRGRIHPAFDTLTNATMMDIVIMSGWPFQPPAVFVEGLNTNHSTRSGLVCMWQDGELSEEWITISGLFSRIEKWCANAKQGWENDHLEHDAFLNFQPKSSLVATFDLLALGIHAGSWGEFHGCVNPDPVRVEISPGRKQKPNHLRGLWFHVGQLNLPPPRHLSEVPLHLPRAQRKGLEKALTERQGPSALLPSAGVDLILFCWERYNRPNMLVLACKGTQDETEAIALQLGPNDEDSLMLRAGPDAPMLSTLRATLFGAGALGGYAATILSGSGIGNLTIVDPDVLLPGNVVRHVAGHKQVGAPKVKAVEALISDHAPLSKVDGFQESPSTPSEIRDRIVDANIVIDTTGNDALISSLAMITNEMGIPFVSGALYRGGFIGRVKRQALQSDTQFDQRNDLTRYPLIPIGDGSADFAMGQLGCSDPVNNAPPSAVLACASLIAQVAVDALTQRFEFDDEVIDVYQVISDSPFNSIGRVGQRET